MLLVEPADEDRDEDQDEDGVDEDWDEDFRNDDRDEDQDEERLPEFGAYAEDRAAQIDDPRPRLRRS